MVIKAPETNERQETEQATQDKQGTEWFIVYQRFVSIKAMPLGMRVEITTMNMMVMDVIILILKV